MFGVLPVVALALFVATARTTSATWRHAVVGGAVMWGVLVAGSTEILGAFDQLSRRWLVLFWSLMVLALGCALVRRGRVGSVVRPVLSAGDGLIVSGCGAVVGAVFVAGFVSGPNNWDSLTYHLSRVEHWLQNGNVDHYPTSIARQIDQPPFAEYAVAHFLSLVGSDRLAFLVQWLALCGCCAVVSLLAHQLGASRPTQLFAAALVAAMPMAILQGSSTQNDLVESFWIVALASVILSIESHEEGASRWRLSFYAGGCVGLAVLTKGVAFVVVPPLGVWLLYTSLRRWGRRAVAPLAAAVILAVALNGAQLAREYSTFGGLTSDQTAAKVRVVDPGPASLLSNLTRNAALEAATPYETVNRSLIVGPVERFHDALGLDSSDPRWTVGDRFSLQSGSGARSEDYAGNPLQFALLMVALVVVGFVERARRKVGVFALVVVSSYVLVCGPFRWQPWGSRLLLPLMVLAAPMVAVALAELARPRTLQLAAAVLLVAAIPWAVSNRIRPLIGERNVFNASRSSTYFVNRPILETLYRDAATNAVEGDCRAVGIRSGGDDWEYPLWLFVDDASDRPVRIEHVGVVGPWGSRRNPNFTPCAVIDIGDNSKGDREIDGHSYKLRWASSHVQVLVPVE